MVLSAIAMLAVTGCAGDRVAVTPPPQASSPSCRSVDWPVMVGDLPRRQTDPDDAALAAWGDPAVIARCGVTPPGPTSDPCVVVDGVDWVAVGLSDGVSLTTYGRAPAVEVLVPAVHGPGPLLLPALSAAVADLPSDGPGCS